MTPVNWTNTTKQRSHKTNVIDSSLRLTTYSKVVLLHRHFAFIHFTLNVTKTLLHWVKRGHKSAGRDRRVTRKSVCIFAILSSGTAGGKGQWPAHAPTATVQQLALTRSKATADPLLTFWHASTDDYSIALKRSSIINYKSASLL